MKVLNKCVVSVLTACATLSAAAQSQGDPLLFGYQHNMLVTTEPTGIYLIMPSGQDANLLWQDEFSTDANGNATNNVMLAGWMRDGLLCGFEAQYPQPNQMFYKYVERNLETGVVSREVDVDISTGWTNYFLNVAYCPADDRIYGYGFNADRTGFAFKSAPADNPGQAVIIKDVGRVYPGSICYNHEYGAFYGIVNERNDYDYTYDNRFVSIDVNTGQTTDIFTVSPGSVSDCKCVGALVWVPARQAYLWNYYTTVGGNDPCSQLVEVNPAKGTTKFVRSFNERCNFFYFVTEDNSPVAAPGAPAMVSDFKSEVGDNNMVTFTFTLPRSLANGQVVEGEVSYDVYVDGVSVSHGTGEAGEERQCTVRLNDGSHFVRVVPEINNVAGLAEVNMVYLGEDSPCAPENIVLTETSLTWDPVSKGVAGNVIGNVSYRVEVNGMIVAETSDTSVDMSDIILTDGDLTNYRATVRAIYNGRVSKAGYSNDIVAGRSWTVPFNVIPDEKQYLLMTQEDVDNNSVYWSLDKEQDSDSYVLTSGFSRNEASEDWIYLPRFTASEDNVYTFSMNVFLADVELSGGRVEVWVGDAPAKKAMKRNIIPALRVLKSNGEATLSGQFTAGGDLAGKDIYIGIGVTSDEGVLSPLRFKNMSVAEADGVSADGPEAVTALSARPTPGDISKIEVSFTLPTRTLAGNTIAESTVVEAVIALSDGTTEKISGKPGETVRVEIGSEAGENLVTVTPSCNGKIGMSANCVSGAGFGLPGMVTNVRVSYDYDNMSLRLDWDAPTTDVNGNDVSGDKFNYNIWVYSADVEGYELAVNVPYPLQFAYMTMEDATSLRNLNVGISAVNSIGESKQLKTLLCQVGTPHPSGIYDDFNGDEFRFNPVTNYVAAPYDRASIKWGNPSKADWGLSDEMMAVNGDVLCGIPDVSGARSRIDLPKMSTVGYSDILLTLDIWTGNDAALTTVKGLYASSESVETNGIAYYEQLEADMGIIPSGEGYGYEMRLPAEFDNNPWISVVLESEYPELSSRMVLAGYSLTISGSVNNVTETLCGTITGVGGMVRVTGYDGHTVNVYRLDGALVASATVVDNRCDIPVKAGIYIVKVDNRVAKVVVK